MSNKDRVFPTTAAAQNRLLCLNCFTPTAQRQRGLTGEEWNPEAFTCTTCGARFEPRFNEQMITNGVRVYYLTEV